MLTPPTKTVFYISLILAILGVLGLFVAVLEPYSFWLVLVGYVLLAAGNFFKGF